MIRRMCPPSWTPSWRVAPCLLVILAALLHAQAQLPVARLETLFPPGGRVGSQLIVTAAGADLEEVTRIDFSHPGLVGEHRSTNGPGQFVVSIASNVPPGNYDARLVGRFGISNPRAFGVSDLIELVQVPGNTSIQTAFPVATGSCVSGRVTAGHSDTYKFPGKAGQHVSLQCVASEIDSRLDPVLWIHSEVGKELTRMRRGGVVDFVPPQDGNFVVRIHDSLNQGGDAFFYRLIISTGPHISFLTPASARPGSNQIFTVHGRNLPGAVPQSSQGRNEAPLEILEVHLDVPGEETAVSQLKTSARIRPSGVGVDGFDFQIGSSNGISNPRLITYATAPITLEKEPNNSASSAQALTLPTEVSGDFSTRGDLDWFSFDAKKGEVWQIEVFSQRIGALTDPTLLLQKVTLNEKGEQKVADVQEVNDTDSIWGASEFKAGHGDPALRFEVAESAPYRLLLRDQGNQTRETGTRQYRLSLRPPAPDFRLVAIPVATATPAKDSKEIKVAASLLRRGGVIPLKILSLRRDGFDQEIQVSVEGLPPGVSTPGARIPSDGSSVFLMLRAEDTVSNWAGAIRVMGKSAGKQGEHVREARGGTVVWNAVNVDTEAVASRLADNVSMAVSGEEIAPLTLELGENPTFQATAGAKIKIPARLIRRAEFAGNTKLRLTGHPLLGAGKEVELDGKATNATFEIDLEQLKFPAGDHPLHLEMSATFQMPRSVALAKAAEESKALAEKSVGPLKDAYEKAKAALSQSALTLAKAETDAKTAPDKQEALKQAQELHTVASKASESAAQQVEANEKQRKLAEESVKLNAKRDFTETFYSTPMLLKVSAAKPADKGKS